ncbi:MAG: Holliday junction ATP-dependent DNA helicase RuvA [Parcubacteria group bacterium GW2011_GWA2_56_7]|nr:MAG: Holliday junction ATP-dependent DNA helicase RuvA [Parcubacteria group bacterium GW2011_GWA2_56_7]
MINKLTGDISYHGKDFIVVDVGDIGYKIVVPGGVFSGETRVTVFTHEVAREDARELFGFRTMASLELFWKLIAISGVGPRGAQKIIYSDTHDALMTHIQAGEIGFLTRVPGVGKKTAQKILIELKGALVEGDVSSVDQSALSGLMSLGYPRREAEEALQHAVGDSTEERLRSALKVLGS